MLEYQRIKQSIDGTQKLSFGLIDAPLAESIFRQLTQFNELKPIIYEHCMQAKIVKGTIGSDGCLLINFPKDLGLTELPFHIHPHSDRLILVLSGAGKFHYLSEDHFLSKEISSLDVIFFKKGLRHTFTTLEEQLNVLAFHLPFQELSDPELLVY